MSDTGRHAGRHSGDAQSTESARTPSPFGRLWRWLDEKPVRALLIGLAVTAVLYLLNLPNSPDFDIDEVAYALAGQHVGASGSVSWDSAAILVHPPLYFGLLGVWMTITGHAHGDVIAAIHAARYFDAICDIALVALIGIAARVWTGEGAARRRGRIILTAVLLAALNGFLLRFGRAVLIDPTAILFSMGTALVAWQLRTARAATYVGVVGGCIGLSLLTKEPAVFIAVAPLVAAVLRRERRAVGLNLLAFLVGLTVWSAFPIWAAANGHWASFYSTQTISLRRLLGVLQLSGLNRAGASPSNAFLQTFLQYAGGYLIFFVGLICLIIGTWRFWRKRLSDNREGASYMLGLGLASYAFLIYSVTFGQSEEQLTLYVMPAAVLLAVDFRRMLGLRPDGWALLRVLEPVATLACALAIALGAISWSLYDWPLVDNANESAADFISRNLPACAPVNATGDIFTWRGILRRNPVYEFGNGPQALSRGVHIFLLSPKNIEFHYGVFDAEFVPWLKANGHQVYYHSSHTYKSLSVWVVGDPTPPAGESLAHCVAGLPPASPTASVWVFAGILSGILVVDALGVWALGTTRGRRTALRA